MKGFIVLCFVYAICIVAGITGITTQTTTPSPTLEFNCDSEGKITKITAKGWSLEEFIVLGENQFCNLTTTSCVKDKSELRIIHVKKIKEHEFIIGGKDAHFYEMRCKPGGFVGKASANINITDSGPTYTPNEHTYAPKSKSISLTVEKKGSGGQLKVPFHLGEQLTLTFTGPDGYVVDPVKCTAYAGAVGSETSQELWSNATCSSKDTAFLENYWTKDESHNNVISITMYAFRFPDSNTVSIECSAHFCPKLDSTCKKQCWMKNNNTIGRRRRDTVQNSGGKDHYMKKVSTFFTVVDDSITSNRCSGASMNTFLYLATIVIISCYFT